MVADGPGAPDPANRRLVLQTGGVKGTPLHNTAIHEAGHAVIATLVGLTVIELTVEPTDESEGLVILA